MHAGSYRADVDLMLERERRTRKVHLSDLFDLIDTYPNAHTVIHFAPCRVHRPFDIGATVHG